MAAMDFLVVLVVLSLAHSGTVMGHGNQSESIVALEKRVALLEAAVAAEEEDHNAHHAVLFSAFRSSANDVVAGQRIIFDEVNLNGEDGYNATTGIFTCPEDGIYSLSYSALLDGGAPAKVALVKEWIVQCALFAKLPPGSSLLSERTTLLKLAKGEQVWVEVKNGTVLGAQGQRARGSFQGYRISN